MDHPKRGIALVINIKTYNPNPDQLRERVWSEQDVENLKKTIEYLEFDLKFYENLKADEIRDTIKEIAEIDHKDSDCFLCVVMSHGNMEKIICSDSQEISFNEIMAPIKSSCASLNNKPKLFFFQACRGKNEIEANNQRPGSSVSTSSGNEPDCINEKPNNEKTNVLIQISKQETAAEPKKNTEQEKEADLLVYFSTISDHFSLGNIAKGTIFIDSVCQELNKAYEDLQNNMSLDVMIKKINERVKRSTKQLSETLDRFSASIYFKPKNVSFDKIY